MIEKRCSHTHFRQARFLRLAFHDCIGGCNGCVDLSVPENLSLCYPMAQLKDACPGLSRADCWALAAVVTVEQLSDVTMELQHVGRQDCVTSSPIGDEPDSESLPSAMFTTDDLLSFFATEFGFDAKETVAIMGAHTLGSLSNNSTGFDGAWTPNSRVMDNEYYQFLIGEDGQATAQYDQDNASNQNGYYAWSRRSNGDGFKRPKLMLNADMALVRDLTNYLVDTETGEVSCVLDSTGGAAPICDLATETLPQVVAYSNDNLLWLEDFRDALTKMMTKGYSTTHCIDGSLCILA